MALIVYPPEVTGLAYKGNGLYLKDGKMYRFAINAGSTVMTMDSTDPGTTVTANTLIYKTTEALGFKPAANLVHKVCIAPGANKETNLKNTSLICGNYHTFGTDDTNRNLGLYVGSTSVSGGANLTTYGSYNSDMTLINVGSVVTGGPMTVWHSIGLDKLDMIKQDYFTFHPNVAKVFDYYSKDTRTVGPDVGGLFTGCTDDLSLISSSVGSDYAQYHFTRKTKSTDTSCDTVILPGLT
jgi:hypothetical protein